MTSRFLVVVSCQITGETVLTWGNCASTPPILIDMGALLTPAMKEVLGGCTITSAPMPAWRCRASFSTPTERPTISRISVTSRAIATMLISDRMGRCTRLATIILFIMGAALWLLATGCWLLHGLENHCSLWAGGVHQT